MKHFITLLSILFIYAFGFSQSSKVTVTGTSVDPNNLEIPLSVAKLKRIADSSLVQGSLANEVGLFEFSEISPGNYILELAAFDFQTRFQNIFIGSMSPNIDLGKITLQFKTKEIEEVVVNGRLDEVSDKLDKKTFAVADNVSQAGGSALQTMQNLPGVTIQDGKVLLRGNDRVVVLIDGKQTALTGFGNQSGLDNLPASAIDRIEIINNPSSKFDSNGNAGIINIILKKNNKEGFNGKVGLTGGVGALWIKKGNLPTIRPQYQFTPKVNPSLQLNYRKKNTNLYLQADYLFTETLNKNEFVTRTYDDGTVINQQTVRNRNTGFTTVKTGFDWTISSANSFSISGMFGSEKILDHGDEPFFNKDSADRIRLWRFLEDELKTTVMGSASFQHKFKTPGELLNMAVNYTFHRENEKYFFENINPTFTGNDAFKLLSDEQVIDFTTDHIKPLKYGRIETGLKVRDRGIPTNMQFIPGLNSPLDTNAGGWAKYRELIPAVYGNYVFENKKVEAEVGLRLEYVKLNYDVNPNHNTYKSNGYSYAQPFPTVRFAYKLTEKSKISLFYNRRVDRPNEVDIRIFPKYDDAEIIKVGNPALRPQFTNSFELGYKSNFKKSSFYLSAFHKIADATITRISTTVPGNNWIYAIFQNAGRSYNTGLEIIYYTKPVKWYALNVSGTVYHNQINAFSVVNLYPVEHTFSTTTQEIYSGNIKLNNQFFFKNGLSGQISAVYLAPDLIPQGKIGQRFSLDFGVKKSVQKGKGEWFINATDVLNTMVTRKTIQGNGFSYISSDYYETQVVRFGYSYKF